MQWKYWTFTDLFLSSKHFRGPTNKSPNFYIQMYQMFLKIEITQVHLTST